MFLFWFYESNTMHSWKKKKKLVLFNITTKKKFSESFYIQWVKMDIKIGRTDWPLKWKKKFISKYLKVII